MAIGVGGSSGSGGICMGQGRGGVGVIGQHKVGMGVMGNQNGNK